MYSNSLELVWGRRGDRSLHHFRARREIIHPGLSVYEQGVKAQRAGVICPSTVKMRLERALSPLLTLMCQGMLRVSISWHIILNYKPPAHSADFRVHTEKGPFSHGAVASTPLMKMLPNSAWSHLMSSKPQKLGLQDFFVLLFFFSSRLFKDRKQQPFPIWSKPTGLFLIPFISISFTPRDYGMFPYLHNGLIILSSIGPSLTWWQLCFPVSFQVYWKGQTGLRHPENILFMFL